MRRFPIRSALLLAAAGAAVLGAHAQSADPERGALLYENHCQSCHTTEVHFREGRKSESLADVRAWVARWQDTLDLSWTGMEIEDVARHLNGRFYQFTE